MRSITLIILLVASALLSACAGMTAATPDPAVLRQAVAHTERAFAKSMADRDHAAFSAFLSEETVFFSGAKVLRGKATVAQAWKRFYESPTAPFSWQPEQVEVLPSGTLALTSGPVHNAQGKLIGTFTSIWRLETAGVWRIIFDKGNEVCNCPTP
ncbi:MAG: nuclear transport factor 2 family protein [Rhodoferax sp.]|nr:nuclear transport factor 2 family protein [Rhodoferax sp.]